MDQGNRMSKVRASERARDAYCALLLDVYEACQEDGMTFVTEMSWLARAWLALRSGEEKPRGEWLSDLAYSEPSDVATSRAASLFDVLRSADLFEVDTEGAAEAATEEPGDSE